MSFTKGPWKILAALEKRFSTFTGEPIAPDRTIWIVNDQDEHVALVYSGNTRDVQGANAALIAAGPEMLEALRIVVGNLKANGDAKPLLFGALIKAEAAIAKAEPEPEAVQPAEKESAHV